MKSFNEFLNISEEKITKGNYKKILKKLNTGQTVSGEKPTNTPTNTSKKGIDPKEVNRRLSASTTKGDQVTRMYGTAGSTGDSNMGAGAGGASGNKASSTTSKTNVIQKPARNTNINIKHADSKVTFGQGQSILPKDATTVRPTPKPTDPNTFNTIPSSKRKPSLWKKLKTSVKKTYRDGGKGSGTIHKLGGMFSGITAGQDDLAKGRSKPRAIGKGLTSFGAYMSAKPLSRVPKVGPILSAVVGDVLQKKSGKIYDKVADKVTGQSTPKSTKKKSKYNLPSIPMQGSL